jgi:hypothetical protein
MAVECLEMEKCASCSAPLSGPYCSACGEKKLSTGDLSIAHFAAHALHDIAHFDTKVFSSLIPLLFKPGFLTAEFMAGRWKNYIKPTTLFVLLNAFFFFAHQGVMNWDADEYISAAGGGAAKMVEQRAAERGKSLADYKQHFTEVARERQHLTFLLAIPVVALVLLILFRHRYFVEHLVYSIHFHAFALIFLTVGLQLLFWVVLRPVVWIGLGQVVAYLGREPGLNYLVALVLGLYHFLAVRRVYRSRWFVALGVAPLLVLAEFGFIVHVFEPLVFYWVYYAS